MSERTITLPEQLNELKDLKQWVCYKLMPQEGKKKPLKVPFNPVTGKRADAGDPESWGSFDQAVAAYRTGRYTGIGFEFAAGGGYMGIDLDNVIDPGTGEIKPFAESMIRDLSSYTEYSPSGTGFHILIKTDPSADMYSGKSKKNCPIELEMYNRGRYFTVTGNVFLDVPIADRTIVAKGYNSVYVEKEDKKTKPQTQEAVPSASTPVGSPSPAAAPSGSDAELWEKMFASQKGQEIRALYDGDISVYGNDHSRADQALVNHLAYWTNGDAGRMDSMFRQSGLYATQHIEHGAKKWDRNRGARTYGEITIQKALADFNSYVPPLQIDYPLPGGLTVHTVEAEPEPEADPAQLLAEYESRTTSASFQAFEDYLEANGKRPPVPTGFASLDRVLNGGLTAGLYIMGAISSLGKTSWMLNIGDNISAAGRDVLYYSLEMSRFELMAKSISRISFQQAGKHNDMESAFSTFEVLNSQGAAALGPGRLSALREAMKIYRDTIGKHMWIFSGISSIGVDDIAADVKKHIQLTGRTPVVFIDYLQVLRPEDPRSSDKQNTDRAVVKLKTMSAAHDIPVFCISSLNRANYSEAINMTSFKESGLIEYSADSLIGLQLYGIDRKKGESDNNRAVRIAEIVKKAEENPQIELEVKVLKNRNGQRGGSGKLLFDKKFNSFIDVPAGFTRVSTSVPWGKEDSSIL